jgi:signal transduction histidine kinase
MRLKLPVYLNIRQKIILGFVLCMAVIGTTGALSYRYLTEIERKQHFVEIADDLSNIILEIRRYEKNYLLYGSQEDFSENQRYVADGNALVERIKPELADFKGMPLLVQIEEALLAYDREIRRMAEGDSHMEPRKKANIEEHLREYGKTLVDSSQELVSFERKRILKIIQSLKQQLIGSLMTFLLLGASLIPLVARKIIRPLRIIEKTTHKIASGDFRPIPVADTRDETQRVVEAFNRMVTELKKRQDQLIQAKKLASLGTLTSGIAHQLNNPLNNISTSCQIAIEEFHSEQKDFVLKMLSNVVQEVNRARDIVRGLLEFSRVKEFSKMSVSLRMLAERSIRLMSCQVPSGIDIVTDIPEDLVLELDPQRMQEVLLNLIENAVHAIGSPPGEIRIAARLDESGSEAVLAVEDTGPGIEKLAMGRIFDPFFTTKEVGKGTGLGLAITYGIIEQHGGTIVVENREPRGARFRIRLPIQRPEREKVSQ